jgi:hypothetical protein
MQGEILVLLVKTPKLSYNNTEQCASPPSGTHHLVLERCYFSSDSASAKAARPSSCFGLSQQHNFSNQERKADIVEAIYLAEGGSLIPGCLFCM